MNSASENSASEAVRRAREAYDRYASVQLSLLTDAKRPDINVIATGSALAQREERRR